jgi:NADPH:quinone reductase-like Zn-dependent oxidoreductase
MNANKGVFGVNLKHLWDDPELMRVWAGQVLELWSQGAIKPRIARSFSFAEAAAAHHFLQDRKNIGKVILTP